MPPLHGHQECGYGVEAREESLKLQTAHEGSAALMGLMGVLVLGLGLGLCRRRSGVRLRSSNTSPPARRRADASSAASRILDAFTRPLPLPSLTLLLPLLLLLLLLYVLLGSSSSSTTVISVACSSAAICASLPAASVPLKHHQAANAATEAVELGSGPSLGTGDVHGAAPHCPLQRPPVCVPTTAIAITTVCAGEASRFSIEPASPTSASWTTVYSPIFTAGRGSMPALAAMKLGEPAYKKARPEHSACSSPSTSCPTSCWCTAFASTTEPIGRRPSSSLHTQAPPARTPASGSEKEGACERRPPERRRSQSATCEGEGRASPIASAPASSPAFAWAGGFSAGV
eukprot:CAMPEP_0173337874 /NCGR_PEP_ID=MMETSP1144-20121109/7432_1 /TAXON_ID=483371 /ORGANISM="non described non described, Strain CCMP2298" /LENGTH=344 /DNA_ID=CAMNT_0014283481 /DNA_START=275 /DNA_END=1310 /DNA_ORIENTATION=+